MSVTPEVPIEVGVHSRLWHLSIDLMCVTDTKGVLLAVNKAWTRTLGWTEAELRNVNIESLIHPADLEGTRAERSSLARGRPTLRFDNRLRCKDGTYRQISWRAAPAQGLTFAVGRDITERLEREALLRQAQKMDAVGQLAGGIAHDFNNLLTILKSSVEYLQKAGVPEERRARYLSGMATTVDRATKLTSQLLAFARRQKLEPEVFEVGEKIAEVCQLLRPLIGDGIEIVSEASAEPCFVEADVCQFETVLMNLAINARDAMEGQGEIHFQVEAVPSTPPIRGHAAAQGDFVAVQVRDTGPGISTEISSKVFEPFFTTKPPGQGTGLGLSQVYGFVKQSGGNIDLRSGPDGAVFTIYLPRCVHASSSPEVAPDPPPAAATADSLRVLLVEDNEEVGRFCLGLLNDLGHRATWVSNAAEALALLEAHHGRFDVVFSDVVMPGMSGLELAEHLRTARPDLPVVLSSGYSPALANPGAHGFRIISKPYSPTEVSEALKAVAAAPPGAPAPRDPASVGDRAAPRRL
jgi:PAS domain S-box-containing protein